MLGWNPSSVDGQVISADPQAIHCTIVSKVTRMSLSATLVYGFNRTIDMCPLFSYLFNQSQALTNPWIAMDDFNYILDEEERIGGRSTTNCRTSSAAASKVG